MTQLSFEAIRKQMQAAQGQATQATISAATRAVEAARSFTATVHGVMPATNNKLDARTEQIFAVVEKMGLEVDALYSMLGMQKPMVQEDFVSALVAARMASIKSPAKKEEEVVAPAPARLPELPSNAPVAVEPVVVAPEPEEAPEANVAPVAPTRPTNPLMNDAPSLQISTPTNWHMGPVI